MLRAIIFFAGRGRDSKDGSGVPASRWVAESGSRKSGGDGGRIICDRFDKWVQYRKVPMDIINLFIALVSLVLALIAFRMQIQSNKQMLEVQRQILEINNGLEKLDKLILRLETLSGELKEAKSELSQWIVHMS